MPRTICYLENGTSGGGSFESLALLATHLDRARYTPFAVFVNPTPHVDRLRAAGISVTVLMDPIYSRAASSWERRLCSVAATAIARAVPASAAWAAEAVHRSTVVSLAAILVRERVALLHCNDQSVRDWYGIVAARRVGVPVVSHLRSVRMDTIPASFASAISRSVAHYIANSQYAEELWRGVLGISSDRTTVIPNAIVCDSASALDIRAACRIPWGAPVICCVGNFTGGKGQEHLVAALSHIHVSRPDVHCIFVGDGALRAMVERRVDALGVRGVVRFLGYRSDARDIIAACDILVVPSDMETFGRAILEGYAARTPVVATCVGGIPEVVRDGITGLLVSPADPSAMADAVLRFLGDPVLVARCVAAGYDVCARQYDVAKHVAAITRVYDDVLKR